MSHQLQNPNQANIKIVIIGNSGVGKTALMERFVYSKFSERRDQTLGATYVTKRITRGRQTLVLSIWDTAGTERYRAIMKQYYRNAKAAIICYDITYKVSWDVLKTWVTELRNDEENCRIYICGTKKDLVDDGKAPCEVDIDNVKFYAQGIGAPTFVTSSKTGESVEDVFSRIATDLWDESLRGKVNGNKVLNFDVDGPKKKPYCCS